MANAQHMFVVTGGPGSGKSSLIDAMTRRGFRTMPEAGRAIIQDQVRIGGPALPWADRAIFAELMLGWELRSYHEALASDAPVLMDRLIKDSDAQGIVQQESISTESASTASTSAVLLVHTLTIVPVSSDASATTRTCLLEFIHILKEDATHAAGLIQFHILIRVIRQILIAASQIITGSQDSDADARI